jgi:hypothetical protein
VGDSGDVRVDPGSFAWYNLTVVKRSATTVAHPARALGAELGRGTFTAYYWRFS